MQHTTFSKYSLGISQYRRERKPGSTSVAPRARRHWQPTRRPADASSPLTRGHPEHIRCTSLRDLPKPMRTTEISAAVRAHSWYLRNTCARDPACRPTRRDAYLALRRLRCHQRLSGRTPTDMNRVRDSSNALSANLSLTSLPLVHRGSRGEWQQDSSGLFVSVDYKALTRGVRWLGRA
jgi:hypothetical protein